MITSTIKYLGNLRTEATHVRSGNKFITDAPPDNNGKGEAFSPSDTAATALGSCMLTIMGMAANTHSINIDGTVVNITKHMTQPPDARRISAIDVEINFPEGQVYSEKERTILKKAALTCPVALSLHPEISQNVTFSFEK